jgi:hypothetical protein
MMKPHCDNCDTLIVDAPSSQRVTVQPYGYQCELVLTIFKQPSVEASRYQQVLCAQCLYTAVMAFAASLQKGRQTLGSPGESSPVDWGDRREKS